MMEVQQATVTIFHGQDLVDRHEDNALHLEVDAARPLGYSLEELGNIFQLDH
jgi:hypothetical protein